MKLLEAFEMKAISRVYLVFTGSVTYCSSQIEAEYIAVGKPSRQIASSGFSLRRLALSLMGPFFKATPFQVDEILTDGQVLPVLGGLRVLDTAGHTPGHISFFAPAAAGSCSAAIPWSPAKMAYTARAAA